MLTVKIISGTYGHTIKKKIGDKTTTRIVPKNRMSEPFELEDAEAKRLVSLGVAEIITEGVATGEKGKEANPPNVNPSNDKNGKNGENEGDMEIGGHLDEEQFRKMTNKDLKALAEDMGIDTSKMKVKDDYIRAIVAVEVSAPSDDENSETPPNISPEAPVV